MIHGGWKQPSVSKTQTASPVGPKRYMSTPDGPHITDRETKAERGEWQSGRNPGPDTPPAAAHPRSPSKSWADSGPIGEFQPPGAFLFQEPLMKYLPRSVPLDTLGHPALVPAALTLAGLICLLPPCQGRRRCLALRCPGVWLELSFHCHQRVNTGRRH